VRNQVLMPTIAAWPSDVKTTGPRFITVNPNAKRCGTLPTRGGRRGPARPLCCWCAAKVLRQVGILIAGATVTSIPAAEAGQTVVHLHVHVIGGRP